MVADFDRIVNIDDPDVIQMIWNKGVVVDGYNQDLYRQDAAGAWISREAYKERDREFGWEIDHIYPVSKGGDDRLVNLRPMNWRNNLRKSDDYPIYIAAVVSKDDKNILQDTTCKVSSAIQEKLKELYNL